jgi:WD40 repeat protein
MYHRLFACVGQKIKMYNLYSREQKHRLACELDLSARGSLDYVGACDLVYIEQEDLLVVLQMNLCISFFKFMSRTFLSLDYISPSGEVSLSHQPYRLQWSLAHKYLVTAGNDHHVMVWTLKRLVDGSYKLLHRHTLKGHTDVVQALIFIKDREGTELLVSAGMDRRLNFWDLSTFRCVKSLAGHQGGITCLAYDGEAQIFSAGYDTAILVWDVLGSVLSPMYKLTGPHKFPLQSLTCSPDTGRLCSLDRQGKVCWWDVRKAVALDPKDRCIQQFLTREKCTSAEMVNGGQAYKRWTLNGVTLVLAGNRTFVYDCIDPRPPDGPPTSILFNLESVTLLTVHGSDVKVWDACGGRLLKEFNNISRLDITGLALDQGCRKILVANQEGELCMHNYFNGKLLRQFPPHRREVSCMIYTPKTQLIITSSWDRSIRVVDELSVRNSESVLRVVDNAHDSDIVALAYSHELCLIGSATADVIKVWDFQFMSLEGTISLGLGDVSGLAFLTPYPILLAADNSGGISLIPVRPFSGPGLPRHVPLLRVLAVGGSYDVRLREEDAQTSADTAPPITQMAVGTFEGRRPAGDAEEEATTRQLVVVGNAMGVIRVYDFSSVLAFAGVAAVPDADLACRKQNYNPRRKVVRDAKVMGVGLREEATKEESLAPTMESEEERPRAKAEDAEMLSSWVAHDDAILSIQLLDHPSVIFSSSRDMSVKLWSVDGRLLGVLTWGRQQDLSQRRFWNFPFDFAARQKSRTRRAKDILAKALPLHMTTIRRFGDYHMSPSDTGCLPQLTGRDPRDPTMKELSPARISLSLENLEVSRSEPLLSSLPAPELPAPAVEDGRTTSAQDRQRKHVADLERIFGQLQGKITWSRPDWEVGREEMLTKLKSQTKAATQGRRRKKKRKKGQVDPVLQSIKQADRAIQKFGEQQEKGAKGEAPGRGAPARDPFEEGKFDLLRADYETRHQGMYHNLASDAQKQLESHNELARALKTAAHIMEEKEKATRAARARRSISHASALKLEQPSSTEPQPHITSQHGQLEPTVHQAPQAPGLDVTASPVAIAVDQAEPAQVAEAKHPMSPSTGPATARSPSAQSVPEEAVAAEPPAMPPTPAEAPSPAGVPPTSPTAKPKTVISRPTHGSLAMESPFKRKKVGSSRVSGCDDALTELTLHRLRRGPMPCRILSGFAVKFAPSSKLFRTKFLIAAARRLNTFLRRRFGPYPRDEFMNFFDAFRSVDPRKTDKASLRDLLATPFAQLNREYRTQLEKAYFGRENGEARMLTMQEALRLVFPILTGADRREAMLLITMYEDGLKPVETAKKSLDLDHEKMSQLKGLFDVSGMLRCAVRSGFAHHPSSQCPSDYCRCTTPMGVGRSLWSSCWTASKTAAPISWG